MTCDKCTKPITVEPIQDQPVDTLENLPDFFLAERIITSPETGQRVSAMTRVPSERLFGNGKNMDNVTTLEPNNTISVPENQVLAGRVVNNGSYNVVELTTANSEPDFLIVGTLGDLVLVQSTGFVVFPNGHQYIAGQQYYSGENGLPTTSPDSGHKLFKAISDNKIVINM